MLTFDKNSTKQALRKMTLSASAAICHLILILFLC